ncbi:hypothetical protein Salat_1916100 [Sesamum alatum]|uniref:Uncharacterized protein n=1 Tax=Sesamum alatum TaxID=300844 RepID=A0AAE2CIE5_9LAMI|nr:hypothetical protein Salat_1916100 [Sesamum alatum]
MALRYFAYTDPTYNNMSEIWGSGRLHNQIAPEESSDAPKDDQDVERPRGGPDAPIVISESNTSIRDSCHFTGSWDLQLRTTHQHSDQSHRRRSLMGPRHSYDAGSGVGDMGSWSGILACNHMMAPNKLMRAIALRIPHHVISDLPVMMSRVRFYSINAIKLLRS